MGVHADGRTVWSKFGTFNTFKYLCPPREKVCRPPLRTHLTVTRTCVEFRAGLGVNPVKTSYRIAVTVPYVADSHAGRVLADVPERNLTAHQAARQTLRVSMVELERNDRIRRLDREIRNGRIFYMNTVISITGE